MERKMKEDIHPDYQDVLFVDSSNGHKFVCGTTLKPKGREEFDGKEYPVVHMPITSASHPFFTGDNKFVDTEGRVEKFLNKYKNAKKKTAEAAEYQEKQEDDVKTGKKDKKKK
jgi:large subunit ribosomal protein L31